MIRSLFEMRLKHYVKALEIRLKRWRVNFGIWRLTRQITYQIGRNTIDAGKNIKKPIVFFNASTRLMGVSLNAAFAFLAAAGVQLAGFPVIYFACHKGMKRCVLGTNINDLEINPPCGKCVAQSRWLFSHAPTVDFQYQEDDLLLQELDKLTIEQLENYSHQGIPLGKLVLPSIRWILRRHHLLDDDTTRILFRDYILSAHQVARDFKALLARLTPHAVVVFNGMSFPEATVRWIAHENTIPVVTHEVGLRPFSAFFTFGDATAYPLNIQASFQLDNQQEAKLDEYLTKRFKGEFSMAGIKFWDSMSGLDDGFQNLIKSFRQVVPVFTNVIFDTSQPHSNVVFPHMFAWLDLVYDIALAHPETLFVIRAHPDESRKWKESQESVAQWVQANQIDSVSNIHFVDSSENFSSYELIQQSKFVMIYNSTIGLEASILGIPVICAGKARFTQIPTVLFPRTVKDYRSQVEEFLNTDDISLPEEFQTNARRFLYYQLYRSSLPFDRFLEADEIWPGFVRLKNFHWSYLLAENSLAAKVILEGLENGEEFILKQDVD